MIDQGRFTLTLHKFIIMDIGVMYQMTDGKEGPGHKQYTNSYPKRKSLPVKYKDRQTYVKSVEKLSKEIPGPGKYTYNP